MEHKNISELTTEPKTLCIYIASAVWIVAEIDMFAFRVGLFSGIIGKACHMERAQQKMNMFWMCEKWERFQLTYIFCPNSFLNKWKVTCLKHNSVIFFFFCLIPWERRNGTGTWTHHAVGNLLDGRRLCPQKHECSFSSVTAVYFIRKPMSKNRCRMKLLLEPRAIWLLKGHFVLLERKYENSPFGNKS